MNFSCIKDATVEWTNCPGCGNITESESSGWRIALVLSISLLALPSNLLVMLVFYNTPALHTNQGIYMLSLAVSDFGSGLCFLLFAFRYAVSGYGPSNRIELDFGSWIYYLMLTATLVITIGIGLDKLHQIKLPYSYDRMMSKRKVTGIVFAVWAVLALLSFLPTRLVPISGYYYEFTANTLMFNTKSCRGWNEVDLSLFGVRIGLILFMVLMLVIGYGTIFVISRRHINNIRRMRLGTGLQLQQRAAMQDQNQEQGQNLLSGQTAQNKWANMRSSLRGWITNACVILGFLVCWLPFFAYKISIALRQSSISEGVEFCLAWLAMAHTSINAAIYGGTYKPFKKGLKRFFRRRTQASREDMFLSRSQARTGGAGDRLAANNSSIAVAAVSAERNTERKARESLGKLNG